MGGDIYLYIYTYGTSVPLSYTHRIPSPPPFDDLLWHVWLSGAPCSVRPRARSCLQPATRTARSLARPVRTGENNITCRPPPSAAAPHGELVNPDHVPVTRSELASVPVTGCAPPPPLRARAPRCTWCTVVSALVQGPVEARAPAARHRLGRPKTPPVSVPPPSIHPAANWPPPLPPQAPPAGGPPPARESARESAARAGGPRRRGDIQPRPHRRGAPCIGPAPARPRTPCPSV